MKGFLSQETALAPCAKQDKNKTSWKNKTYNKKKKTALDKELHTGCTRIEG